LPRMRLLSLKIKGFKSFAQETLLYFNEDIIGIVGPNGSGKSNIIDAIRWVLGEQKTSELRLESMSNVLFNGTKKRKASPYAEVTITFENDRGLLPLEFKHVSITRTLHRSGNSEYKINDVNCRLKDIQLLLSDTGIGSDTYAIIALGMVDEILSDRDAYRRRMLEQAAGISKYKSRKKESLQKLQLTEEDLTRVEDLLAEIGANLKTLEKQAKKARKFFEVKEQYKYLSLQFAKASLNQLNSDFVQIQTHIEKEQSAYIDMERQMNTKETELSTAKLAITADEERLSAEQQQLSGIIQQLRDLENRKTLVQDRRAAALKSIQDNAKNAKIAADLQINLLEKMSGQDLKLKEELMQLQKMEADLQVLQSELNALRETHTQKKQALQDVFNKQKLYEQKINALERQLAGLNAGSQALARQIAQFQDAFQLRIALLDQNKEGLILLENQVFELQQELNELQASESKRKEKLEQSSQKSQVLNQELMAINKENASVQSELNLTRSLVENLEGYPESIKFLSKQQKWMEHAILFSDIFTCDDQYKVAIENFLESYLNYFVVPDRKSAEEAIRVLGHSQKGKAHFFVLSGFPNIKDESPVVLNAGLLPAIDLIRFEEPYRVLLKNLFRGVYIQAEEGQLSSDLLDTLSENTLVLSRSGDMIIGKRWMSGGSLGLFEGRKIGRKKNLERLEIDLKSLDKKRLKVEKELDVLRQEIAILKQNDGNKLIDQKNRELQIKSQELHKAQTRIEIENASLEEQKAKHELDKQRLSDTEGEIKQCELDLEAVRNEYIEDQEKAKALDDDFRLAAELMSGTSASFNELNIHCIQQKSKTDIFNRELAYTQDELNKAKERERELNSSLNETQLQLAQFESELAEIERRVQQIILDRKSSEQILTQTEQRFFEKKNQIIDQENTIRTLNKQLHQLQGLINQLKDKHTDLRFRINGVYERLEIEFELDRASVEDFEITELPDDPDHLKKQIELAKSRLLSYNDINPLAVEAYDEIKQRFDLIETQRNDIMLAKTNLLSTIAEIDHNAKSRFMQTFDQVRTHFAEVFRHLFTEDDFCDIVLEDSTNPLESGIQIIAKPKGKRPQTLQQLSGGEKTLTAIAFLFAIYLIKPAPFCIFDEVDAPLDDANIEKFSKIISKFSGDSQFIVVTHNKGTMAEVNAIYGVFMEEQGVSNLSKVDFSTFKHSGLFETVAKA
jgi:chromosome segregation protein